MLSKEKTMKPPHKFLWAFGLLAMLPLATDAFQDSGTSKGQTVYVSVYSSIFTAPKGVELSLESTLIVRNTDMENSLTLSSADFYDTKGILLRKYVEAPMVVGPLETKFFFLHDAGGGVGANFVVRWSAAREINIPIIECLTIGTKSGQGISFISPGRVIKEKVR